MDELSLRFIERHPHDAARIIEQYTKSDQAALLAALDAPAATLLLRSMPPQEAAGILAQLDSEPALGILEQLPPGIAAACLRRLTGTQHDRLVEDARSRASLHQVERLLRFPPNVAGAVMDPGQPVLQTAMTIREAVGALRRSGEKPPDPIYLVNQSHILQGYVELADLLLGKGKTPLQDMLRPVTHTLAAHTRLDTVRSSPGWQLNDRLPVIDSGNLLLGVLTAADLASALGGDEWAGGNEARDILLGLTETFINACTEFLSTGGNRR